MDNIELATALNKEIALAAKAEQAYEIYFKDLIEAKQKDFFEEFCACQISDQDRLVKLKELQAAFSAIDTIIQSDIDAGKMASIQLKKLEGE